MAFDEDAIDFLNKLPKEIKERIFNKIVETKTNPFHYFERLAGRNEYKLRVGDYRVIAEIENEIRVVLIGHRKNVYNL